MAEEENGMDPLERELVELGPLMVEQERLESVEPDPVFGAQLRAHLVDLARTRPAVPALPEEPAPRVIRLRPWGNRWWVGVGGAVLAAAAAILLVLRMPQNHPRSGVPSAAWYPPAPTTQDLTKSYPLLGGLGGGGMANPIVSRIEYPFSGPYPGHLQLSAGALPAAPATVIAYRLRGASFDDQRVAGIARQLSIEGGVTRKKGPETIGAAHEESSWVVVAHGGGAQSLHSVAVSMRTGQLIYHDFDFNAHPQSAPPPERAEALAASRAWLTRLGWPGASMPVVQVPLLGSGGPGFTTVGFGWPRVGQVDLPAATLWVSHGGRVDEALLLPPVENNRSFTPRPLAAVWKQLQAGKVPVGVENMMVAQPPNGSGTLQAVAVQHVFTSAAGGALYLVPVYRFGGTARFPNTAGPRRWFALAPALPKARPGQ